MPSCEHDFRTSVTRVNGKIKIEEVCFDCGDTRKAEPKLKELPKELPDHHGATYVSGRDKLRLNAQQRRIFDVVKDGQWHLLSEISKITGDPEASISARLRDFRKEEFGAFILEREYIGNGLHRYRLVR